MDARFAVIATRPARRSAGRRPADRALAWTQGSSGSRRGFTLVEMLTVVVIIGILASLITGAVIAAKRKAMNALTGIELNQFDAALKTYKERHAEYPPDFSGLTSTNAAVRDRARWAVIRHLEKAFPRYRVPGATLNDKWTNLTTRLAAYGVSLNDLDPSAALVFWLGGLPDGAGSTRLIGFSANARDPFDIGTDPNNNGIHDPGEEVGSRLPSLCEFIKPERLKLVDGVLRYFPDIGGSGENAPYVYFRASNGGYSGHPGFICPPLPHPQWGSTAPCWDTRVPVPTNTPPFDWANRDSFQIRAAGLDGVFGMGRDFPRGEDYDEATYDDQTNFSGGTLEDKM